MKRMSAAAAIAGGALIVLALAGCAPASSSFTGTWGSGGDGKPSLTIESDGTFSGTDGCNNLHGKGDFTNGTFVFGAFASTLMACPDVDTWLSKASTARASNDVLTVYAKGGAKLGTLDRR